MRPFSVHGLRVMGTTSNIGTAVYLAAASHAALSTGPMRLNARQPRSASRRFWVGLHATMQLWPGRLPDANWQVITKVVRTDKPDVTAVAKTSLAALVAAQDVNKRRGSHRCTPVCAVRPASGSTAACLPCCAHHTWPSQDTRH